MGGYAAVMADKRKACELSPGDLITWGGTDAVVTSTGSRYGKVQLTIVTNDANVRRVTVMRHTGITVR